MPTAQPSPGLAPRFCPGAATSRRVSTRTRLLVPVALLLLSAAALSAPDRQEPSVSRASEYAVKAAYLFNFTKYVEWPTAAFNDPDSPLLIGILGRDPFGDTLEQTIARRTAAKRKVEVRRSDHAEALRHCHLVFISSSERERLPAILNELKGSWALTVGEMPRFLEYGMILFVIDNEVVRFDVSLENVKQAGLKISARMLASARKVFPSAVSPPR